MKTVQDYILETYEDCYTNQTQVPLTVGLRYFNEAVQDVEKRIAFACRENFFYEKIRTNLIAGTDVYGLPLGNSDGSFDPFIPEFANVTQVRVKYRDNAKYYRAKPLSPVGNIDNPDTLADDLSETTPKYEIRKNNLQIFPTPKENVTDGLQIDFRSTSPNYQLNDTEQDIPFPWNEHIVIKKLLRAFIFLSRGKLEEKAVAEDDYEKAMAKMLSRLSNINNMPVRDELPNLSYYTY